VSSSQTLVLSDANGLATIQPSNGAVPGAIEILDTAAVGGSTLPFSLQSLWPVQAHGTTEPASGPSKSMAPPSPRLVPPQEILNPASHVSEK
jgi:hypothetical protein